METSSTTTALHEAAENASKGIRDPEAMKKAREHMDEAREALRRKLGVLNVAVDLIRDTRDE
jgi:hypothetical protein